MASTTARRRIGGMHLRTGRRAARLSGRCLGRELALGTHALKRRSSRWRRSNAPRLGVAAVASHLASRQFLASTWSGDLPDVELLAI